MNTLSGLSLSLFFGFAPMLFFAYIVYWLDRYEKEPKMLLLGVFTWGAVLAAGAAFLINTVLGLGVYLFTESELAAELSTGSVFAPLVEESLKGMAVLAVFLLFRHEFDSYLDGIVYAAVAALGFAATENTYYIFNFGFLEEGFAGILSLTLIRVGLVGWQHPFYTAFIGIGLAAARLNRSSLIKLAAPFAGWSLAVFTHSLHNTLASFIQDLSGLAFSTLFDWAGWTFMFLFILWAIHREQRYIIRHLREEMALGVISAAQYNTACSAWAQSAAAFTGLLNGQYRATRRFYQLTGELAHKKHQRKHMGEEAGNTAIIQRLRAELAGLAHRAGAVT